MTRETKIIRRILFFLMIMVGCVAPAMAMDDFGVIETETGFYYIVQKGDTLWDLSKKFSDSPWVWPSLWKENDQLTNPHWIFPGQRIQVYKKSVIQAAEPVPQKKPTRFFNYSAMEKIGFIRNPAVTPVGRLGSVQSEKTLISEGDIIYIQPTAGTDDLFISGSLYTLFRYMQPVADKSSLKTIGTQHYILGTVEVVQKDADTVTAKVIRSFHSIKVGDLLMPSIPKDEKIPVEPGDPAIEGQILGPEDHQALIGDNTIVFINKGAADNVTPGQQYVLFRQQALAADVFAPPMQVGKFTVLHVEETTATVVITNAYLDIVPGEWFRASIQ